MVNRISISTVNPLEAFAHPEALWSISKHSLMFQEDLAPIENLHESLKKCLKERILFILKVTLKNDMNGIKELSRQLILFFLIAG